MDYIPVSVTRFLEGRIDPHAQHLVETYSQTYLIALTAISFFTSYLTSSVLIALELFIGGLVVLLLATVPPWSYLNQHPIKLLPARKAHVE